MENNYVVVFHPNYRSDTDIGLRIYNVHRAPLEEHMSYTIMGRFSSEEEANTFISNEIDRYYFSGYDEIAEPLFV